MEITFLQIVLVFIVACIAGMESVLDEFQFHRPLIACTLIGAVLGDMKTGIIIGGTLEMIALGWMNIGAAVAPDAALASIISTILVIAGHQSIGAGIALAIPLAAAGQVLTIIVRTITVAFQHAADKAADNGNLTAISWIHVSSLFLQAMRVAIPAVIVALSVGTSEVQNMLNAIPEVVTNGLNIAGGMIQTIITRWNQTLLIILMQQLHRRFRMVLHELLHHGNGRISGTVIDDNHLMRHHGLPGGVEQAIVDTLLFIPGGDDN